MLYIYSENEVEQHSTNSHQPRLSGEQRAIVESRWNYTMYPRRIKRPNAAVKPAFKEWRLTVATEMTFYGDRSITVYVHAETGS